MNVTEFVKRVRDIADNYTTTYALGTWGWNGSEKMKNRAITKNSLNRERAAYINVLPANGFMFDCAGLIKGILWGWCGDSSKIYGGAGYACNGVPDTAALINYCTDVSTDFSKIETGELVYIPGHVGVCVDGEKGLVVECTTNWSGKVLYSYIAEKNPTADRRRKWSKHGKMSKWIEYNARVCPTCGRPL